MLSISNLEFSLWKRKKPRLLLVAITWWCGIVWFGEKSEEPRLDVVKGSEQALFTSANQLFWFLLLLLFLLLLPISPFCHMFWWKSEGFFLALRISPFDLFYQGLSAPNVFLVMMWRWTSGGVTFGPTKSFCPLRCRPLPSFLFWRRRGRINNYLPPRYCHSNI